ncbi:MAG: hypothetical protein ABF868_08840 [Sporolactobacillus sp.]
MGNTIIVILGAALIIGSFISIFRKVNQNKKMAVIILLIGIIVLIDGIIGRLYFSR